MSNESAAPTTTLRITFAGLCLLVRDDVRTGKPKTLHVLLPGGTAHGEAHEARLYFDARYLIGDGVPSGTCEFDLRDVLIDLTDLLPGSDADLGKTKDLADLRCVTGDPVPRVLLDSDSPGSVVKSRISLAAGSGGRSHPGARWKLAECTLKYMPTNLEWVIAGLPAGAITLRLAALNNAGVAASLDLRPVGNKIELFVFHSPETELPRKLPAHPLTIPGMKPKKCYRAAHFAAFYPLVGASEDGPAPVHEDDGTCAAAGREPDTEATAHQHSANPSTESRNEQRGFDYGCMLATAVAAP
jgi:hypothetical protein